MYATTGSIFGFSNIYLYSTATVLLAVIIAFFLANMFKDDEPDYPYDDDQYLLMSERAAVNEVHEEEAEEEELLEERKMDADSSDMDYIRNSTGNNSDEDDDDDEDGMPVDGLVGKLKTARLKELEAQLTRDQLEEERRIEREQLAAIFELLKKQEAELNMKEIDEKELVAQLNLYR